MADPKKSDNGWKILSGILFVLLLLSIFTGGFGSNETPGTKQDDIAVDTEQVAAGNTFKAVDDDLCTIDGKVAIYLFSTTWCPHCKWIKDTFEETVRPYEEAGKIAVRHWELDTKEDVYSQKKVSQIPSRDLNIYQKYNPQGTVPTFVFGCKYYRIGNGYESEEDLGQKLEEAEFKSIIEELIGN